VAFKFMTGQNVTINEVDAHIRTTYAIGITKLRAANPREIAKVIVEGNAVKQYCMLWSYAVELRKDNS